MRQFRRDLEAWSFTITHLWPVRDRRVEDCGWCTSAQSREQRGAEHACIAPDTQGIHID